MELNFKIGNDALFKGKKIVGVMSGKGGVGKSTVSALFAMYLQRIKGIPTGMVDVDFTGSSQGKIFHVEPPIEVADGNKLVPKDSESGVKVMTLSLLLDDPEKPVIWRAPIMNKALTQFFEDTLWDDVQWLVVDLPPGTSDIPLSLMQKIPVTGFFLVTSPQDLVKTIVAKTMNMAKMLNKKVLGVVENYGYYKCPNGDIVYPFGKGKTEEVCSQWNIPFMGRLPIDSKFSEYADRGILYKVLDEMPEITEVFENMYNAVEKEG
ncbi:P-loop NTPase [bacterium 3DAC]|jgi:Mrp family chromosome partitioning ATPase|nr:Mrp/NBP35 family ATP-binding protein [Dictyoglomota bacterium]UZN23170.1 P-loop NTPase [bacterium 3DAC]